jgi:hypothetical protein
VIAYNDPDEKLKAVVVLTTAVVDGPPQMLPFVEMAI